MPKYITDDKESSHDKYYSGKNRYEENFYEEYM